MAVRILFDGTHNPIQPTLVLATRRGKKLGALPAADIVFKDTMNSGSELSFKVYRPQCESIWNSIVDFKLVWAKDWNRWFEIEVETEDSGEITKSITATSLGEAELSQINLYDKEINTEDDIDRDDYVPTVFYDPDNENASLLDRLLEKAPHYSIGHVDTSLKDIQRTFSFDDTSIYNALQDVAEEIECLITIDCTTSSDGKIARMVNAYDLKTHCLDCNARGDFTGTCDSCDSTNIADGYGNDTTIYVSSENLADEIKYSSDNDSVKNCFKLETGDDLMTAAVVSCNPNGSAYLWHISDETKQDMSDGLREKLESYDTQYAYYQNEHTVTIPSGLLTAYNNLIEKYSAYSTDYQKLTENVVGYPALMSKYFDTIDFGIYLKSGLMPSPELSDTTAAEQLAAIQEQLSSPVSVKDLDSCSASTAESSVLAMAKAVADSRYKITVSDSAYVSNTWSGIITVTNYSDEEDTATSSKFSCTVNGNYENYVKQKILKTIAKTTDDATGVDKMFQLSDTEFAAEMKKYCQSRLSAFHDICQSCIDILIQHGISNDTKWLGTDDDLYTNLYLPYYSKLGILETEMKLREKEIATVVGAYDTDGNLTEGGVQSFLSKQKTAIQDALNFNDYLGSEYVQELAAYRREDTYSNSNYISDGLNNKELLEMAQQFIKTAQTEIEKSSTLQHSISATLQNLLTMKDFEAITDYFEIGNWIRVRIDGKLFKLRLIEYEIDFDDLGNIDVEFSDVISAGGVVSDVESILSQASTMATSYDYVAHQAKQGEKSNSQLSSWVDNGLNLTTMKIVDSADNQNISMDSHGLSCKEYLPTLGTYDDRQLRLINRGLYLTDDNWKTSKAGIGDFEFWNPKTEKTEEAYGVIANTIVGNIILSKEVGIYNQNNSIALDEDGLTITANGDDEESATKFIIQRKATDEDGAESTTKALYLDSNGNLVLSGTTKLVSGTDESVASVDDLAKPTRYDDRITQAVQNSQGIIFTAMEGYSKTSDVEALKDQIKTQLSILSDEVQVSISKTAEQANSANSSLQAQIDEICANYKFTADGQYIGRTDSDTVLRLVNDVIQILVSNSAVVSIDRKGLTASEANIDTLHIGDYVLSAGKNGHLTLS